MPKLLLATVAMLLVTAFSHKSEVSAQEEESRTPVVALTAFFESSETLSMSYKTHHHIIHGEDVTRDEEQYFRVTFDTNPSGALRERIEDDEALVTEYWDGKGTLFTHDASKKLVVCRKLKRLVPSSLGIDLKIAKLPPRHFPIGPYFFELYLYSPQRQELFERLASEAKVEQNERVDGNDCWKISLIHNEGDYVDGETTTEYASVTKSCLWIDKETGAPRRCLFEQRATHGSWSMINTLSTSYVDLQRNESVDREVFSFTSPEDTEIIPYREILAKYEHPESHFIPKGNVAPDFSALTLKGQEVKLSDFKGKVVVLSFGAFT